MGYGSRALKTLNSFYSGEYFNLSEPSYPDATLIDPVRLFFLVLSCPTFANHRLTHIIGAFSPLEHGHSYRSPYGPSRKCNATVAPALVGEETREFGLPGRFVWIDTAVVKVRCLFPLEIYLKTDQCTHMSIKQTGFGNAQALFPFIFGRRSPS